MADFLVPVITTKPNYRFPMKTARKDLKQRPEDELQKQWFQLNYKAINREGYLGADS